MRRSDPGQLGLFAEDPEPPVPRDLDWPADLLALAGRLAGRPVFLGTSSWSFPGWAGLVYPPGVPAADLAGRGLAWYARHPLLRAVGVDRSYYGPLTAGDYRAWAAQVPAGFRFLAKAERSITTPPDQLPGGARSNEAFLSADHLRRLCIEPLLAGLGPGRAGLILQFPPLGHRHRRDPAGFAARLAGLLRDLPAGIDYFVEVRNGELLVPEYFAVLAAAGVGHCFSVHPGAPPLPEQAALAGAAGPGPLLVRWNLQRDRRYDEAKAEFAPFNRLCAPDPATRAAAAGLAAAALAQDRAVVILANNKAEGSAPLTLVELAREIDRRIAADGSAPAAGQRAGSALAP
jgi:uncharacterized protein YecE (DUF72 family)